jgi:hypothetical protein
VSTTAQTSSGLKNRVFQQFSAGGKFGVGSKSSDDSQHFAQDSTQPQVQQPQISEDAKLDIIEQAISEVEAQQEVQTPVPEQPQLQPESTDPGVMAQAVAQQATQPDPSLQQPPNPTPVSKKEAYTVNSAEISADLPNGVQAVEQEPNPEIAPEIESFLEQKQENIDKLTEEIVVADNQPISKQTKFPTKPVVVVPITEEQRKKGKRKSPQFSLRWLVEWSLKIIKKFSGEVIYRQEQA